MFHYTGAELLGHRLGRALQGSGLGRGQSSRGTARRGSWRWCYRSRPPSYPVPPVSAVVAVVAVLAGWLVVVPPAVSTVQTGNGEDKRADSHERW